MTRERAKELLPVIQAFAEGREIECRSGAVVGAAWVCTLVPSWCEFYEYRIKPEPPKPREWWVNVYPNGFLSVPHYTRESAEAEKQQGRLECVHVREVL